MINQEAVELRSVHTNSLELAVEMAGPANGPAVLLLHGWPDSPRTWDRMLPTLHMNGFRTFAPYLRGCGPTRFRSEAMMRSGQLSALGRDVLEAADALGLERFSVVGHDWGARAAYIAANLAPERIDCCAAMSVGWGTNGPDQPLSLLQAQNYWYHWLMALPRGEAMVRAERVTLTRYIWDIWNPGWTVADAEFAATAASFDNPDWADVVLHSYRVRWGLADEDPSCRDIERQLAETPTIRVPTLVLHGKSDPCNAPSTSEGKEGLFGGPYGRVALPGLGHFPHRQAPELVLAHLVPLLHKWAS
ncbi:alpha/beta fold hydrolase [Teichococcus wenyumeiae]|uniref:alpha/beta fold hydrolase n=1 Tax=Teichococcus wenyumeiae TaxID=2478470 RepID=UPI0018F4F2BB|nr:alpha/beta hydrolase [Pseudoroseomonas wenyumeiae]